MPKARKDTIPIAVDEEMIEGRYAELGDYTVAFESFRHDVDPAPFFKGLPDDRCQCPHWGQIVSGTIVFRWSDHEEKYAAGDVYYAPPGHLPLITAGTEVVEFSPTEDLRATMTVVEQNMARMGASS